MPGSDVRAKIKCRERELSGNSSHPNRHPKRRFLSQWLFFFFSLYQYGGLLQPHLMLEANNPRQRAYEYYCRRQHTSATQPHIVVTEDSKGRVAQTPLPKWRKEQLSCAGRQVTIRLRGRRARC